MIAGDPAIVAAVILVGLKRDAENIAIEADRRVEILNLEHDQNEPPGCHRRTCRRQVCSNSSRAVQRTSEIYPDWIVRHARIVMRTITTTDARPMSGSAIGKPRYNSRALATTARLTNASIRA